MNSNNIYLGSKLRHRRSMQYVNANPTNVVGYRTAAVRRTIRLVASKDLLYKYFSNCRKVQPEEKYYHLILNTSLPDD